MIGGVIAVTAAVVAIWAAVTAGAWSIATERFRRAAEHYAAGRIAEGDAERDRARAAKRRAEQMIPLPRRRPQS